MQTAMIGIGAIGRPMAEHVVGAGIPLRVYDIAAAQVEALVAAGATGASSAAEAATGADVVGIVVRSDEQMLEATLGERGAVAAMPPGSVLVLQSTVLPETVVRVAEAAAARGVGTVDAPVTGGPAGALAGTLIVMAGGTDADLERCRPFLEPMSKQIVHCGALGSGMTAKLCNNLVGYLGFLAASEATRLAHGAGLDPARLDEVLDAGGLMTQSMRAYLGLVRADADPEQEPLRSMLDRVIDLAEKDLGHTLAAARDAQVVLPGAEVCRDQMARVYRLRARGEP